MLAVNPNAATHRIVIVPNGFWPVLGVCLYVCWRHGRDGEVITVRDDRVIVDKGDGRRMDHREFSRYWAQLAVHEPAVRLHTRRFISVRTTMSARLANV